MGSPGAHDSDKLSLVHFVPQFQRLSWFEAWLKLVMSILFGTGKLIPSSLILKVAAAFWLCRNMHWDGFTMSCKRLHKITLVTCCIVRVLWVITTRKTNDQPSDLKSSQPSNLKSFSEHRWSVENSQACLNRLGSVAAWVVILMGDTHVVILIDIYIYTVYILVV